jgi:hypothetical protein
MTPFTRLLRNLWQRARGTFYEGPEPPERLTRMAYEFTRVHQKATRSEWLVFAVKLAEESYRSGYMRGLEWAERDLDRRDPQMPPEEAIKHMKGHDWAWSAGDVPTVDPGAPHDDLGKLPPWDKR